MTEPTMSADNAEEYTQALAQVAAGNWRQILLGERLGVPERLGLTTREWVETRIGGYIRMSIPERKEAVAELAGEGLSQRKIAEIVGVTEATVNRDLHPVTNVTPEPEQTPLPAAPEEEFSPPVTNVTPEPEERVEPVEPGAFSATLADHAGEEPPPLPPNEPEEPQAQVNEGDEWYTPRWLFDALGIKFQIDVCSPADRTYTSVPAERWFTIDDDGLAQPWEGTIWCNPPYSKPEPWARRIIHHGDGLLLTHMPMNAGWCVDVWETCDAIRLFQAMEFIRPDGTSQRPGYWLQLAAFGPVATEALSRLQPLGAAAFNKRRVASPMWQRAS